MFPQNMRSEMFLLIFNNTISQTKFLKHLRVTSENRQEGGRMFWQEESRKIHERQIKIRRFAKKWKNKACKNIPEENDLKKVLRL